MTGAAPAGIEPEALELELAATLLLQPDSAELTTTNNNAAHAANPETNDER